MKLTEQLRQLADDIEQQEFAPPSLAVLVFEQHGDAHVIGVGWHFDDPQRGLGLLSQAQFNLQYRLKMEQN